MCKLIVVNPADWMKDITGLLERNWSETGMEFDFNPSISIYDDLYQAGYCFAILAIVDEVVVGYCSVIITKHPHNPDYVVASNDALFVDKQYRKSTIPGKLILTAEKQAMTRGACKFMWHCRAGTDLLEVFMRRGGEIIETVVSRGL